MPSAETRLERECPWCAETILARAHVCKHCHRDVVPIGSAGPAGSESAVGADNQRTRTDLLLESTEGESARPDESVVKGPYDGQFIGVRGWLVWFCLALIASMLVELRSIWIATAMSVASAPNPLGIPGWGVASAVYGSVAATNGILLIGSVCGLHLLLSKNRRTAVFFSVFLATSFGLRVVELLSLWRLNLAPPFDRLGFGELSMITDPAVLIAIFAVPAWLLYWRRSRRVVATFKGHALPATLTAWQRRPR
jgi:hypothetical protein